jgi:hypothetical protein
MLEELPLILALAPARDGFFSWRVGEANLRLV